MKNLMNLTGVVAILFGLSFFFSACQDEEGVNPAPASSIENLTLVGGGGSPYVDVYSPRVRTFGKTYNEWTIAWWNYMLSIPSDRHPINDKTGANALVGQTGPVVFLAGSLGEPVNRNINLTSDKAILVPVVTFLDQFQGTNHGSQPKPGQTLEDFLKAEARGVVDQASALVIKVDGKDIRTLSDYRVTSDLFYADASPDLKDVFGSNITDEPRAAVSDGYFILLKGLKKGNHTIQLSGKISSIGSATNVTYNIRVTK